jgi:hypothetical protein
VPGCPRRRYRDRLWGAILRWLEEHDNLEFYWVVLSSDRDRKKEALEGADLFLQGARKRKVLVEGFRNGFFPYVASGIKEYFKEQVAPDIILTHYRHHLILEYEIPKYEGDLGRPNLFVHLNEPVCQKKIQFILETFEEPKGKTLVHRRYLSGDAKAAERRIQRTRKIRRSLLLQEDCFLN